MMKKVAGKNVAIASGIICILLAVSLVGAIANYTSIISAKDNTIANQDSTINNLNSQLSTKDTQITENDDTISSLTTQIQEKESQIQTLKNQKPQPQTQPNGNTATLNSLNAQIANLQNQISAQQNTINELNDKINNLTATINSSQTQQPILVFHVCEKGENYTWGHLPNATDTCNQILTLDNNTHNILLLPEYEGHANWTEELAWIANNFGGKNGIPIMLEVFGGGNETTPTPMLTIEDISAAMTVANIKYLRFAEVISWHLENQLPFPNVTSILAFCKANNLKLFWTEWKVETFQTIQTYINGYEDIVTVSFSTNSEYVEPADGFMQVSQTFQHWGGSVQAWYWEKRYNTTLLNMPPLLLIQQALSAKEIGAEILQFEPYWYFFDNGQANENLKLLETMLA